MAHKFTDSMPPHKEEEKSDAPNTTVEYTSDDSSMQALVSPDDVACDSTAASDDVENRQWSLHHVEPSMNDLTAVMRAQDADLLESINFRTANDAGETPLLTSLRPRPPSASSLDELPELFLPESVDESLEVPDHKSSMSLHGRQRTLSQGRSLGQNFDMSRDLLEEAGSVEGGGPFSRSRRALSGEVWTQQAPSFSLPYQRPEEEEETNKKECKSPDPEAESSPAVEKRKGVTRTESMDRRLNEAAQFAEAVGDLPPAEQDELRIIEDERDDEDDDDEDDDATVVHVEPGKEPQLLVRAASAPMESVTISSSGHHRLKSRPQWPFHQSKRGFLVQLPDQRTNHDFVYKGIRSNPPDIVTSGSARGNYAQLHRKAWLEVSDKYHRYGKNLRLYYRYWERLGCPTNMFFDWLDSKGEAAGQPLPEMEECPRSQLDADTVLYITNPEVSYAYALRFIPDETGKARVRDVDDELVVTGPDGWIFVLRDNVMYGAQKITSVTGHSKQRFHHSSFFGGKAVAAAGIFVTDEDGYLTRLYPHSGHYRPGEAHVQRVLFFLHEKGVDLRTFEMDIQQILHVARDTDAKEKEGDKGEKKKKIESLILVPAVLVACYLAHKARFIGEGVFSQIHRIRKADVTTVGEALELIDKKGEDGDAV